MNLTPGKKVHIMTARALIAGILLASLHHCLFARQIESPDSISARRADVDSLALFRFFTSHRIASRDIKALPFRGTQNYLTLIPGVVDLNGSFYVRGGRANEIHYLLHGMSTSNRFFNNEGVYVIPEAIDRIGVLTGAFGAEYGWSSSAIVETEMRTGGSALQYSVNVETDQFATQGREFLGTVINGYRNIVAAVGGPLPYGLRFFVAGEHNFVHNRQPIFLDPFRFDNLVEDGFSDYSRKGMPLPRAVEFRRNYLDRNWYERNTLQGNVLAEIHRGITIRLTGSYTKEQYPEQSNWPLALPNYYRQKRNQINEATTYYSALQAEIDFGSFTKMKAGVSWYDRSYHLYDPDFGDDWKSYPDSARNAQKGYAGWRGRYWGPSEYSTIYMFRFPNENAPNTSYTKNEQSSLRAHLDVAVRPTPWWELQIGASSEAWRMRSYTVYPSSYVASLDWNGDGVPDRVFPSEEVKRLVMIGYARTYGYDYEGNLTDDGYDAPRMPRFFATYAQSNVMMDRLSVTFGARYEIYDLRMPGVDDLNAPVSSFLRSIYIPSDGYTYTFFDESRLVEQPAKGFFLPRVNLSLKLTDDLFSFVSFGRYAQLPALRDLLQTNYAVGDFLQYKGMYSFPTFLLHPELNDQVEFGMLQPQGDRTFGFSLIGYIKSLHDLTEMNLIEVTDLYSPRALLNTGDGIVKGLELNVRANLDNRLSVSIQYAFTDARATSSNAASNLRYLGNLEYTYGSLSERDRKEISMDDLLPRGRDKVDYVEEHRCLIGVECTLGAKDGPILDGTRFSFLFKFNSGHPYRRTFGDLYLGSATPWLWGVRPLLDPRYGISENPRNASITPGVFNIDVRLSRSVTIAGMGCEFYINVLNLLNTKNVINVYPRTGMAENDAWITMGNARAYSSIPMFDSFYRAVNDVNGWEYAKATGNTIYGPPRQIRAGLKVEM